MLVKALSRIGDAQPIIKQANLVTIEDDNGTIVAVAASIGKGLGITVAHAGDPDFNTLLQQLGINRITICNDFAPKSPEELLLP